MVRRGGCPAKDDDYTVIHGRIRLPVFQKGTAPYLEPSDGGEIELDGSGEPVIQSHQDVCIALSIPTDDAPASGYPVLVYGHGTGGNFNGEMDSGGFAGPLARASVPSVLVGIDLPSHGARRGDSKEEPEGLFYNFLNPRAARDNVLQGSADLMAVIRWVKESGGLDAMPPLPAAVPFDDMRIALMGHSQGATHSALIASYEPDVIGVVLSGNGGNLASSLLNKTSPVDIASVVPLALMDPDSDFDLAYGEFNPALALIQSVFDRADPVNYAPRLIRSPTTQVPTGHHVFMTYGLDDTYAPEETQKAYVRAASRNMPVVSPSLADLQLDGEPAWPAVAAPVQGNATVGGESRTIAVRQYQASSPEVDGHFVGTRNGEAGRADVERFLTQLLAGQVPSIGR
jgi:pimeloyl-ACP methyl ester carboxylesterase